MQTEPRQLHAKSAAKASFLAAVAASQGLAGYAQSDEAAREPRSSDDAERLADVVVRERSVTLSSPKFTAPLLDTPQTLTIVPQAVLSQQGAGSLSEALRNTPGITFMAGEGGFVASASNFNIRGFDATNDVFIDGVRDSGNYSRDIYNLEQVEIAKGPAADNGRGGGGGYVNLSTKTPRQEAFQSGTFSYGFDEYASIERKRATFDMNQPLAEGVAARVNVLWQDGGVAGRDYAEKNAWGIAPSLALGLGADTRVALAYEHTEQDNVPDWGVPGGTVDGTSSAINRPELPVDRSRFYGLVTDYDDVTTDAFTARLEKDFSSSLSVVNQTRYAETDREAAYTIPGNLAADRVTVGGNRHAFYRDNQVIANQTTVSLRFDAAGVEHELAAGLDLAKEKARTPRNWAGLGAVEPTNVYQPDPFRPVAGFGLEPAFIDRVTIDTAALYAYDTARFNERWQATGGIRVERYDARYRTEATGVATSDPSPDFDSDDTLVSGKLGLVFKPQQDLSLYAAWSVAKQPPGANALSNPAGSRGSDTGNNAPPASNMDHPNAKPQESVNLEAGVKWDAFERRLSTSVALFRTERRNVGLASDATGVTAYGDQTVQGVEVGVSGSITEAWSVFGGFAFLDSENSDPRPASENLDGDELAFTPKFSGNLWTTYRLPSSLTFGAGLYHTGESYVGRPSNERQVDNDPDRVLPAFTVLNLMASYDLTENLSLRLNVENVADERYASAINYNSNRAYLGAPRSYLLSADWRF